ncbi:hypothetical protein IMAU30132_01801 [Lactobacillus helveticus]|nr:hypothetical protein [Lactobacillus helveticus]
MVDKLNLARLGRLYTDAKFRLAKNLFINVRVSLIQLKHLDFKEKLKQIDQICNDETLISVIDNYPVNKLHIKQRIFIYLIKYKLSLILAILIKIYLI